MYKILLFLQLFDEIHAQRTGRNGNCHVGSSEKRPWASFNFSFHIYSYLPTLPSFKQNDRYRDNISDNISIYF